MCECWTFTCWKLPFDNKAKRGGNNERTHGHRNERTNQTCEHEEEAKNEETSGNIHERTQLISPHSLCLLLSIFLAFSTSSMAMRVYRVDGFCCCTIFMDFFMEHSKFSNSTGIVQSDFFSLSMCCLPCRS